MNVYVELTKALVEMVKSGGTIAIWGIFVWMLLGIIKTGLVGSLILLALRQVVTLGNNYMTLKAVTRKEQISLLSPKVSARLERCLDDFQKTTGQAMKEFIADAKALLEKSEQSQKKKSLLNNGK